MAGACAALAQRRPFFALARSRNYTVSKHESVLHDGKERSLGLSTAAPGAGPKVTMLGGRQDLDLEPRDVHFGWLTLSSQGILISPLECNYLCFFRIVQQKEDFLSRLFARG